MTLKEYKRQVDELSEAMAGFDGSEEEALKFLESLGQKYAEVSEFNIRAVECKDLEEFKTLANSYGIEFSSDEDAKELFEHLTNGAKTLTKMILSEAEMAGISGGAFENLLDMSPVDGVGSAVECGVTSGIAGFIVGALVGQYGFDKYCGAILGTGFGVLTRAAVPFVCKGLKLLGNAFMGKLADEILARGYKPPEQQ